MQIPDARLNIRFTLLKSFRRRVADVSLASSQANRLVKVFAKFYILYKRFWNLICIVTKRVS